MKSCNCTSSSESYSLKSEFDIDQHKETFINYLEVIILEDGKVVYAVPSHQEKAISIACKKLNKTREELDNECPPEYYCDFLRWLLSLTNSISVWNDFVVRPFEKITTEQRKTLEKLKSKGLYKGCIPDVE